MDGSFTFSPIGYVDRELKETISPEEMAMTPCRIVVRPEFAPGLMGLEPGQYILVLFYFHSAKGYEIQLHPRHDPARPLRGVFATRSQYRPNSIGATVAKVESVDGNILGVVGLDTLDETPVLDIKPYSSRFDAPPPG